MANIDRAAAGAGGAEAADYAASALLRVSWLGGAHPGLRVGQALGTCTSAQAMPCFACCHAPPRCRTTPPRQLLALRNGTQGRRLRTAAKQAGGGIKDEAGAADAQASEPGPQLYVYSGHDSSISPLLAGESEASGRQAALHDGRLCWPGACWAAT